MGPLSRRRLLHGAVAVAVGAAGCNGSARDSGTATAAADGRPGLRPDTGTVPDHVTLRNSTAEPPVRFPPEDDGTATASAEAPERLWFRSRGLVATRATARGLRFADVEGVERAREFLSETEFDAETVYVESRRVASCYTLSLCHVSWTDTSIDTAYGSTYRDADVSCEVDARDAVSMLIRIPAVIDPDAVTSRGSSWSSNSCRRRRRRPPDEGTTDPPNFGPKTPTNATETEDGR